MNPILYVLFFLSGTAALIYEVLWMKELGILFGNTAHAAATTLTVFFLGLSAGGYTWGRLVTRLKKPLKTYGLLEFFIALSACLYFFLTPGYRAIYSTLFVAFSHNPILFILVKLILAGSILFLPAFFMGGTLPVMGQHLIQNPEDLGKTGTYLYGFNTAGACVGAFLAGFILPVQIGFKLSYVIAISLNILIGIIAVLVSIADQERIRETTPIIKKAYRKRLKTDSLLFIALLSGFLTLGLEVLWVRMFSQVLQNSVYAFSMILIVFLLALAFGSFLANILSRTAIDAKVVITALLFLSFFSTGTTPLIFQHITNGLKGIGSHEGWLNHISALFRSVIAVIFIPGLVTGTIFPFLLKAAENMNHQPGHMIGKLVSINTIGSLAGSLCAGFVFLNIFGLWTSIMIFSTGYMLLGFLTIAINRQLIKFKYITIITFASFLFLVVIMPSRLPVIAYDSESQNLLEIIEGSSSTVAVIEDNENIQLKLNNTYQLADLKGGRRQQAMAELPLLIHSNAQSVFFLGLGTGITAGASLVFPIDKVVVCELMPEVIYASKKYFQDYVNDMYKDPRVSVIAEDGRNYLSGTDEKFDVIIADLFLPWKSGVGSLFTIEHFNTVRSRLNHNGLFVQWLPLWQHSWEEFSIIASTMIKSFDQITFWRLDFSFSRPVAALIGHKNSTRMDTDELVANFRELTGDNSTHEDLIKASMLTYYSGNISQSREIFKGVPVNTDDLPLIEYLSPKSLYDHRSDNTQWLLGDNLYSFLENLLQSSRLIEDPYLKNLSVEETKYVEAGLDMFGINLYKDRDAEKSNMFKARMAEKLPQKAMQK